MQYLLYTLIHTILSHYLTLDTISNIIRLLDTISNFISFCWPFLILVFPNRIPLLNDILSALQLILNILLLGHLTVELFNPTSPNSLFFHVFLTFITAMFRLLVNPIRYETSSRIREEVGNHLYYLLVWPIEVTILTITVVVIYFLSI